MHDGPSPEEALLPRVGENELDRWLPPGDSILVRRTSPKTDEYAEKLEAWSRGFVLSRLRADGARDASGIPHPDGFPLVSRALCGARLYIQAKKPESTNGSL